MEVALEVPLEAIEGIALAAMVEEATGMEEPAGALVVGAGGGAAAEVAGGAAGPEPGRVTPAAAQNLVAKARVAAWSAWEQAVEMQVLTLVRNELASQMHLESVSWQPVAPMPFRAQDSWGQG